MDNEWTASVTGYEALSDELPTLGEWPATYVCDQSHSFGHGKV